MRIVPGEALRDRQGLLLPAGVTGNTPDSESGDLQDRTLRGQPLFLDAWQIRLLRGAENAKDLVQL